MSLLRGSGPAAFVSGWKSFVKSAFETEKSNVMSIYNFTGSPLISVTSLEDAEKQYFYNQHSYSGIMTDADLKKVSLLQILKSRSAEFGVLKMDCLKFILTCIIVLLFILQRKKLHV